MSAPATVPTPAEFAVITVPGFGMRVRIQFDGTGWYVTGRKWIGGLDQTILFCSYDGRPPEFPDRVDEFEINLGGTWLKLPQRRFLKLQTFVASVKGGAA